MISWARGHRSHHFFEFRDIALSITLQCLETLGTSRTANSHLLSKDFGWFLVVEWMRIAASIADASRAVTHV